MPGPTPSSVWIDGSATLTMAMSRLITAWAAETRARTRPARAAFTSGPAGTATGWGGDSTCDMAFHSFFSSRFAPPTNEAA
jgi:hypothetical protein